MTEGRAASVSKLVLIRLSDHQEIGVQDISRPGNQDVLEMVRGFAPYPFSDKDLRRFTPVFEPYSLDPYSAREIGAADISPGKSVESVVNDEGRMGKPGNQGNSVHEPEGRRQKSGDRTQMTAKCKIYTERMFEHGSQLIRQLSRILYKSGLFFSKQSQFLREPKYAQALFSQRIMKMNAAWQPGQAKPNKAKCWPFGRKPEALSPKS